MAGPWPGRRPGCHGNHLSNRLGDAVGLGKRLLAALVAGVLSTPAVGSLIIVQHDGATNPDPLGGYPMVLLPAPQGSATSSIALPAPLTGTILIQDRSGDPLPMDVTDAYGAGGSGWWEYDHGSVYTTGQNWIELIMPRAVRAISFHVGASMRGNAWVQAVSSAGTSTSRHYFAVGPDDTQGIGVHASAGQCGAIAKVIIEPWMWGFGNVAVAQGGCVAVPEPGTLVLLAGGLAALAWLRLRRSA